MIANNKKFLIIKGKAGLGNRMLVLLTAIAFAEVCGRKIIIDWSDGMYAENGENAFHLLFNFPKAVMAPMTPDIDSVYPATWRGQLNKSANERLGLERKEAIKLNRQWEYAIDLVRTDYVEDVVVMWGYLPQIDVVRRHLKRTGAELGRFTNDQLFAKLLKENLVLTPLVQEPLDKFKSDLFGQKIPTIGVHIRYTDNMVKKANTVLLPKYYKVIDRIRKREPSARIFLATDSKFVVDCFEKRYGQILQTPKEYPAAGVAMHFNAQNQNKLASAVEALIDMHLLGCCDYILYPGSSTFSYISTLLSGLPKERIIDLQKYDLRLRIKKLLQWWQLSGRQLLGIPSTRYQ